MYAVVGRPRFARDLDDQEELTVLRQVVARCEQSGGFRGLCTIRVNERELINVFFWDTREDGERGRDAVRPVVINLLAGAFDGAPEFAGGEVLFAHGVFERSAAR
jgi:hypothetical protein